MVRWLGWRWCQKLDGVRLSSRLTPYALARTSHWPTIPGLAAPAWGGQQAAASHRPFQAVRPLHLHAYIHTTSGTLSILPAGTALNVAVCQHLDTLDRSSVAPLISLARIDGQSLWSHVSHFPDRLHGYASTSDGTQFRIPAAHSVLYLDHPMMPTSALRSQPDRTSSFCSSLMLSLDNVYASSGTLSRMPPCMSATSCVLPPLPAAMS